MDGIPYRSAEMGLDDFQRWNHVSMHRNMKLVLLWVFILAFVALFIVTVMGVTQKIVMPTWILGELVSSVLVALAGAIIALFKGTKFFTDEKKEMAQIQEAHRKEIAKITAEQTQAEAQTESAANKIICALEAANQNCIATNATLVKENAVLNSKLYELQNEDVFLHDTGIVFKRSKQTGNQWRGFCPRCKLPVNEPIIRIPTSRAICTNKQCAWEVQLPYGTNLETIGGQIIYG